MSTEYKPSERVSKIISDLARPPIIPDRGVDPEEGSLFTQLIRGEKHSLDKGRSIRGKNRKFARVCIAPGTSSLKKFLNLFSGHATSAQRSQIIVYCPDVQSYMMDPFLEARRLNLWPYREGDKAKQEQFESLVYQLLTEDEYSSAVVNFLGDDEEQAKEFNALTVGSWVQIGYLDEFNDIDGVYISTVTTEPASFIPDAENQPGAKESYKKGKSKASRYVKGRHGYTIDLKIPWGPGWRDKVPTGLTPNHRRPGVRDSANELIRKHAASTGLGAPFTDVMLDLAKTESGAMLGRPARPPFDSSGGYGAFQWNQGAWDHAGFGGKVTDISPVDEIAKPIGYYAKLWRQVTNNGGSALAAARHLRVWHRSPVVAKKYRKLAKENDYNWDKAWQSVGSGVSGEYSKRSINKTNNDMKRLGYTT